MSVTEVKMQVAATPLAEADRIMQICNACRYCEGFCAVFPAMARRLTFTEADLNYLANLCHNCGACYYACQYAPPHEFMVNVPKTFGELRRETYKKYAWPSAFGALYERNALAAALITAASLSAFLIGVFWMLSPDVLWGTHTGPGSFYKIIAHNTMVAIFGAAALYVLAAFVIGFRRFWSEMGEQMGDFIAPASFGQAVWDVLTLKYLDGGAEGCPYPDEKPSYTRKTFHHFTFYGFMLCFAATCVGTFKHYLLAWQAPYSIGSLTVILGTLGGIGLLIGPAGLLWLKHRSDKALTAKSNRGMDVGFLVLLFLTSLTGFLLLFLRATPLMGVMLAIHLGVVLGLFLTLPYGKFVHAVYRFAALVRFALERSRPNTNASFD
ncbi:MAG: tricarballylate utilization 4Fe-4S protein TcuB [Hyphomicrobiaceae bacterium]